MHLPPQGASPLQQLQHVVVLGLFGDCVVLTIIEQGPEFCTQRLALHGCCQYNRHFLWFMTLDEKHFLAVLLLAIQEPREGKANGAFRVEKMMCTKVPQLLATLAVFVIKATWWSAAFLPWHADKVSIGYNHCHENRWLLAADLPFRDLITMHQGDRRSCPCHQPSHHYWLCR